MALVIYAHENAPPAGEGAALWATTASTGGAAGFKGAGPRATSSPHGLSANRLIVLAPARRGGRPATA